MVIPVYNESDTIQSCLRALWKTLEKYPHEILICYDDPADSTLAAIEKMADRPCTVRLIKNDLGRGVAFALRAGFEAARGDVVVSFMADLSDSPEVILAMADKIRREGAHVVSGSRYMKKGKQSGGPLLKRILSQVAGLTLHYLAGIPTKDATTNFRGYSADFLRQVSPQSRRGFEIGLELTIKAHLQGWNISEVPSVWQERKNGKSRFKLLSWLPYYLYWYWRALSKPLQKGFIFALLLFTVMLTQISWNPLQFSPHLDVSWNMTLHHAFAAGKNFGSEIIFTYGPYGFIVGPFLYPSTALYHPSTFSKVLFFQAFFCLTLSLVLWKIAHLFISNPWKIMGWLALIVFMNVHLPICLVLAMPLIYFEEEDRPFKPLMLILAAALGLASLIKFSYFLLAAWGFGLISMNDVRQRRLPWPGFIFLIFIVGFWMGARQEMSGFVIFILNSFRLGAGYNEAMIWPGPMKDLFYYLSAVALLLGTMFLGEGSHSDRRRITGIYLLGLVFLIFKSAFVRHDIYHAIIASLAAPCLVALYLPALWEKTHGFLSRTALMTGLAIGLLGMNPWNHTAFMANYFPRQFSSACTLIAGKANLEAQYEERLRRLRADFPFAPVKGAVDLYSYEQSYILGSPWKYNPRPVFQSYAAFSPKMAERNARFLRGPNAPDTIFFAVQPIDNRYPSLDDGLSWPELITRYDLHETVGPYVRLERASRVRTFRLVPLRKIEARLGEEIRIPGEETGPLWAKIVIHPTYYQRMASFFYKSPLPFIIVNGQREFRLIPSLAEAGFLLSPLVSDAVSFMNLATDPNGGVPVKSVRITDKVGGFYQRNIEIFLFRLEYPAQENFAFLIYKKSQETRWSLASKNNGSNGFKALRDIAVLSRGKEMVFRSTGPKPFLLLPEIPLQPCSFLAVHAALTSPAAGNLTIAYETHHTPGFSPMRIVRHPLVKGRNNIFLAIPESDLKGRLILHLDPRKGDYVLHEMEIRGAGS